MPQILTCTRSWTWGHSEVAGQAPPSTNASLRCWPAVFRCSKEHRGQLTSPIRSVLTSTCATAPNTSHNAGCKTEETRNANMRNCWLVIVDSLWWASKRDNAAPKSVEFINCLAAAKASEDRLFCGERGWRRRWTECCPCLAAGLFAFCLPVLWARPCEVALLFSANYLSIISFSVSDMLHQTCGRKQPNVPHGNMRGTSGCETMHDGIPRLAKLFAFLPASEQTDILTLCSGRENAFPNQIVSSVISRLRWVLRDFRSSLRH